MPRPRPRSRPARALVAGGALVLALTGTATPAAADTPVLAIADIQGTGSKTPYDGQVVTTRGVVTAVYPSGGLSGYYIQTPGTGAPRSAGQASDGLFVYDADGAATLAPGTCVEVTGTAGEYHDLTQLSRLSATTAVEGCEPVRPVEVSQAAWIASDADKEAYEGMVVRPTGAWTVTGNHTTGQYGQVALAVGEQPLLQATDVVAPGPEAVAYEEANKGREINLDDGSSWNYLTNATAQSTPVPYLSADKPLRVGDAVTFTSDVILDYRYGWSFQPLTQVTGLSGSPIDWAPSRPQAPQVGGAMSVTSFNVLNYFTDLGKDESGCAAYKDRNGAGVTARDCNVRGAYSAEAFAAQQAKIVAAINALDSSVVGLEEIENSARYGQDRDAALEALVAALNAAAGSERWAMVPSPAQRPEASQEDVIRTAFIYQKDEAAPVGESVILEDPAFTGTARQPLAQAFKPAGAGDDQAVMVIVNHFKSKGSPLPGAFNSYTEEEPGATIAAGGYTLIDDLVDAVGHSYQYANRTGSLDHVLLNASAAALVTGAGVWDVNADESVALEYSRAGMNVTNLYAPDPYRSSDHDPIKVGLSTPAAGTSPVPTPSADPPGAIADPSSDPTAAPSPAPSASASGQAVIPDPGGSQHKDESIWDAEYWPWNWIPKALASFWQWLTGLFS